MIKFYKFNLYSYLLRNLFLTRDDYFLLREYLVLHSNQLFISEYCVIFLFLFLKGLLRFLFCLISLTKVHLFLNLPYFKNLIFILFLQVIHPCYLLPLYLIYSLPFLLLSHLSQSILFLQITSIILQVSVFHLPFLEF